jgi:large conductance mechanosensitive channel
MWNEFKAFVNRGNVLDLAVGVIIGAAFGKIITSFTDDLLMPLISLLTGGGADFTNLYVALGELPEGTGATLAAARESGVPVFAYGSFITAAINFVIMAFVIFMIVRQANRMLNCGADVATPEDVLLLREIRDSLRK